MNNKCIDKTCGPLISNDLSKYTGEMGIMAGVLDNTYKDSCNILIKYNTSTHPPEGFVNLNYLELKNFMKSEGNQSIFKNIEPTQNRDIYDQYMYSSFQKLLDDIPHYFEKIQAIISKFLIETDCDKIQVSYVDMDSPEMNNNEDNLILLVNKNKYDVVLELILGNQGHGGVLALTKYVGIPLADSCFYYTPMRNESVFSYSLDGGQNWTNITLFNNPNKLTKENLLLLLNTYNSIIPNYNITFSSISIPGSLPHKRFKIKMDIAKIDDSIPPNLSAISKFRIKSSYNLLCFEKDIVYTPQNIQNFMSYERQGSILFDKNIKLTGNNKITIHTFLYSTLMHEFMHVLGFMHTHQINSPLNPCRNDLWTNIRRRNNTNYRRLDPLIDGPIAVEVFDQKSIMGYILGPEDNTGILGENGTLFYRNFVLSPFDKQALQQFYKTQPQPLSLYAKTNKNKFLSTYSLIVLLCLITVIIIFKLVRSY